MDTDAMLSMSLDDMIASKAKSKAEASGGGGGGGVGKIRATGRPVRKQQSQPYARVGGPRQMMSAPDNHVYVGNLAWDVTWQTLKDCMKQAGRVVKADVGADASGRSKVSGATSKKRSKKSAAAGSNFCRGGCPREGNVCGYELVRPS